MKNKKDMNKAKTLMMLTVMTGVSKRYDDINKSCTFVLNSIKVKMSKIEINSARVKTIKFFDDIKDSGIVSNDITLLSFLDKSLDILIENSTGNGKIRSFDSIKDIVLKRLEDLKNVDTGMDDSEQLINVLK